MSSLSRRAATGLLVGILIGAAPAGAKVNRGAKKPRTIDVADGTGLASALANARPGDRIRLAGGVYAKSGGFTLSASGTTDQPIVIEARSASSPPVLQDPIALAGANAVLNGVTITAATSVTSGANNRITRCRFLDNPLMALLVSGGGNVRIDHCEFARCKERGLSVKPAAGMGGLRIERNHFRDFVGIKGENVHEPLQLGQAIGHATVNLGALVEWNLFERVSIDSECLSVKCAGNTVQLNTLLSSQSRYTNRFGKNNRFLSNWSENAWGILIRDANQLVVGNRILSSGTEHGLRICAGNVDTDPANLRLPDGSAGQPCAHEAIVANNEADNTIIGFAFEGHTVPATGTRIEGHTGQIQYRIEEGTTTQAASTYTSPPPVRLGPSDVGPDSP